MFGHLGFGEAPALVHREEQPSPCEQGWSLHGVPSGMSASGASIEPKRISPPWKEMAERRDCKVDPIFFSP